MSLSAYGLALNYTKAFLNLCYPGVPPEGLVQRFLKLHEFFFAKGAFSALLTCSALSIEQVSPVVDKLSKRMGLSDCDRRFLLFIISRRDTLLLELICKLVAQIAMQRRNEICCKVITSHTLSDEQRVDIVNNLAKNTGKVVKPEFSVDPNLVLGIRVLFDDHVWESSVSLKLAQLRSKYGCIGGI